MIFGLRSHPILAKHTSRLHGGWFFWSSHKIPPRRKSWSSCDLLESFEFRSQRPTAELQRHVDISQVHYQKMSIWLPKNFGDKKCETLVFHGVWGALGFDTSEKSENSSSLFVPNPTSSRRRLGKRWGPRTNSRAALGWRRPHRHRPCEALSPSPHETEVPHLIVWY